MQDEPGRRDRSERTHASGASGGVHSQRLHGVVEEIVATIADPTLRNAILPRTSEIGLLELDAKALQSVDDICIETLFSVSIK